MVVDWKLTTSHAVLDTRLSTLMKSTTETFGVTSHCLSTRTSCRLWAASAKVGNKGHPRDGAFRKLAFPSTTLAKKIVTAEKFMRLICSSIMWYRAISSYGSTLTRLAASVRRELALQIQVNAACYLMIALRINLMNISAVTIFLARVVLIAKEISKNMPA